MKKYFLSTAAAIFLALPAAAVNAALIVDTGTPTGTGSRFFLGGVGNQSLAGYFSIGSTTTIDMIQGYMTGPGPGLPAEQVTATLFADGAVPVGTNSLFSANFIADGDAGDWKGASDLGWTVGPGNYWLSFSLDSINPLVMIGGAPSRLSNYAFMTFRGPDWRASSQLNIGIRVFDRPGSAPVPTPSSLAMFMLGFGMLSGVVRFRRDLSGYRGQTTI